MKRLIRLIIVQLALVLGMSTQLGAATIYSVQDGLWNDLQTWGGTLPDLASDSIVIAHEITLDETITLEAFGRLNILTDGSLIDIHNKSLNLDPGTVLYNAGSITISSMTNHGTIYNTGTITLDGDLENHNGVIYNDKMIYAKNILTQSGMLSGNGGSYLVENSLNTDPESMGTCTGEPIYICNPDGVTDPCHGPGQFMSGCVSICGLVLDLDLIAFEAKSHEDMRSVEITWTTTREVNISHFIVERSVPHMMIWTPLSPEMMAVGNLDDGTYHYAFVDAQPAVGVNIYRLVCYYFDGNMTYSFIVSAEVEAAWVIGIFPNPFTTAIDVQGDLTGYDKMEIVGGAGQVLWVGDANVAQSLSLDFLENGWYLIRMTGARRELIFPILKI